MRILLAPHAYLPSVGGVERMVEQLASSLMRAGHHAAILTDRMLGTPARELLEGVAVLRVPFIPRAHSTSLNFARNWPASAAAIRKLVAEFEPDIVHQHVTSVNSHYALFAAKTARCPLVITTHGSPGSNLNAAGLRAEYSHCCSAAALTHCSHAALDQFADKHPGLRASSQVIFNGIDCDFIDSIPADRTDFRTVLYAGRIDPMKGVDTLLNAWAELNCSDAALRIVGDGPSRDEYTVLADRLRLSNVTWTGYMPYRNVIRELKCAAIVVLPSLSEGFPMSILEAMASRRAIIATHVGGIPEQIESGENGLLVTPGDLAELVGALRRLIEDPPYAAQLGKRAYERVRERFDLSSITSQYAAVYTRARVSAADE